MREHYQTKKCPRCIGPVHLVALLTNRYIISKGGVMHAHNDDTATDDDLPVHGRST